MLTGGCHCGRVRYETDAEPFEATVCHCSICRRTTGAPFVAWATVPRARFRFVAGTPARLRSSAAAVRSFCPNCGTQLTFEGADTPDETDITTASLDDPGRVPPKDHTYVASRLAWVRLADGLPQYPEAREDK